MAVTYVCHEKAASLTKKLLAARCNVAASGSSCSTPVNTAITKLLVSVSLLLGRRVVINGIVANPELNGSTDTSVRFYGDEGRYSVKLDEQVRLPPICSSLSI